MTLRSFTLNGIPIEAYGLTVSTPRGWLSMPQRSFLRSPLVSRDGEQLLTATARTSARMLGLSLLGRRLTMAQRDTVVGTIVAALTGIVEVVSADAPTKVCFGVVEQVDVVVPPPAFGPGSQYAVKPDLVIRCDDPLRYDLTPSSVSINAVNTPVALPVGLASARMRRLLLYLYGAFTSPITAILKNVGGDELARMTISTATTSSEYLAVDCDAYTITKYSGGVATDVTGTLDVAHDFFAIDPQDTPTLEINKGTAAAHLTRASLT